MGKLFLLFAIVPVAEIALLIKISERLGGLNTFAIVIVTALIGSFLAKSQGFSILNSIRSKLSSAQIPTDELVDGGIVLVCAALLLTPGILTDIVGFLGLIPLTRLPIRRYLKSRFSERLAVNTFQSPQAEGPTTWNEVNTEQPQVGGKDISDLVQSRPATDSSE